MGENLRGNCMEYPKRKNPRLVAFDYTTPTVYFVTLCTKNRERCLSKIVGRGRDPAVRYERELTPYGNIAEQDLLALPSHFCGVTVLQYVIMPDHIHILLQLAAAGTAAGSRPRPTDIPKKKWQSGTTNVRPSVSVIIGQYKSGVSRKCKHALWQASYYDRVVRSEQELSEIRRYMENNPHQWVLDGKV